MMIRGNIRKVGTWYAVESTALGMHTQARTKPEALTVAAAWVRDVLGRQSLDVEAVPDPHGSGFTIHCAEPAVLAGLVLRQRRQSAAGPDGTRTVGADGI